MIALREGPPSTQATLAGVGLAAALRVARHAVAAVAALAAVDALAPATVLAGVASSARSANVALAESLERLVALPGGPPGAVALVQQGHERVVHIVGVGDLERGSPPSARLWMRLASVAKAYSGAVALALVDRGTLALTDTIAERLSGPPPTWAPVTLRQLLNHTSGLPSFLDNPELQARLEADPTAYIPSDELLPYAYPLRLRFAAGERYEYSNTDNIAIALMAESATGRTYEDLLAELVYAPLALDATALPRTVELPAPFLHGYGPGPDDSLEDVSEVLNPSAAWASGGMISTPTELNLFFRGNLGRQLFGRATQARQLDVVPGGSSDPPGPGRNSAGLGIFRYETACGVVYGHTGNFPGYTQFAAASRDGKRSATVSVNLQLRPDIDAEVFAALRHAYELAVCAALAPSSGRRLPTVRTGSSR